VKREQSFRIAVRKFGPFESAVRKQWAAFEANARTGLVLDAQAFDLHPLVETLLTLDGLRRGDWDVAFLNTDWIASANDSGSVLDLAAFLRDSPPDDFPQGWSASLLRLQDIGGRVLGTPYHDGPECLIYRKDLFDDPKRQDEYGTAFGTALAPPQTWDEFHRIARFLQKPGEGLYGAVFAAFPDGHNTVYDFLLQLWTRGGELIDDSGKVQFDTPKCREALGFYRAMLQDDSAVHPRCRELDSVKSGLAFAAGEGAMMVNWFGFAAMCETLPDSRVKGRVDIANVPHAAGGNSTSLNIYWLLSIAAGSPHSETAYAFLRHCLSEQMDKLLTLEGAIGCRRSTWADPEINKTIPFYNRLDDLHANARELPRRADWPEIASIIDELVLQAIQTEKPANQLLRAAAKKAQGLRLKQIAGQ
jgi:multiple sugar transport system substrate-binding protein